MSEHGAAATAGSGPGSVTGTAAGTVHDVVVFGSVNVDLDLRMERLPGPGETLPGQGGAFAPGARAPTRRRPPDCAEQASR